MQLDKDGDTAQHAQNNACRQIGRIMYADGKADIGKGNTANQQRRAEKGHKG